MDAVVGVAVVLASGFVPAPLVIDEDDREALDRTRPGVRDLAGGEAESREDDAATRRERRSPRCDRPAQDPLRLLRHVCPAGSGAATLTGGPRRRPASVPRRRSERPRPGAADGWSPASATAGPSLRGVASARYVSAHGGAPERDLAGSGSLGGFRYPSPTADSPTGFWPSMRSVPPMYGRSGSGTVTVPSSFW